MNGNGSKLRKLLNFILNRGNMYHTMSFWLCFVMSSFKNKSKQLCKDWERNRELLTTFYSGVLNSEFKLLSCYLLTNSVRFLPKDEGVNGFKVFS